MNKEGDDETELVCRAKDGDNAAFQFLVQIHRLRLFRLAMHYVRREEDAHEVVQDTFLAVWNRLDVFEGTAANFKAWISRIAINKSLNVLRGRRSRGVQGSIEFDEAVISTLSPNAQRFLGHSSRTDPAWKVVVGELEEELSRAIERLPPAQREVIRMIDIEEMTYAEVAEALGVALGTIMSRVHRARLRLKELLADLVI